MKSNVVKYIFGIIVIGLVSFAAYWVYGKGQQEKKVVSPTTNTEITMITNLRVPIVNFDTMNPILSKNKNIQEIDSLVFESLMRVDKEGRIQMELAKEYSKVSPTSYLIKLKENIKWQDGSAFTAKDVQYTIDRLKDTNRNSIYTSSVSQVIGVEVIDDTTIKINLAKEVPFFEYNLIFPIVSCLYYGVDGIEAQVKNEAPIGTGRFKIVNTSGNISLEQNENWWNKEQEKTNLTQIQLIKYANMGEVYNAFKLGNIDLLTTQSLQLEEYIGTLGYTKKEYKERQFDFLAFNCENKVLANKEVRQAIIASIDKQNIVSAVYHDQYETAEFPLDNGNYLYTKGSIVQEVNQDKAKECLTKSGWEYKSKVWRKTQDYKTQKLEFNLVVKASNDKRVQVAENIEAQLEAIGIKINLIKANDTQYQKYLENKNYDMILSGVYSGFSPDLSTYFGNTNLANFHTEEMTAILNEVNTITDEKLLKEKYNRIVEIYKEQLPYLFLYYSRNTFVCSPGLVGDIQPNAYTIYQNIGSWYRQ